MKVFLILFNLIVVKASYSLRSWDMRGQSEMCFSNDTPLEGLLYYWLEQSKKYMKGHDEDEKNCAIGDGNVAMISNKTMFSIIEEVQKSLSSLSITCYESMNERGESLSFNGLDDTESGAFISDCETHRYKSDLGVRVSNGTKKNEILETRLDSAAERDLAHQKIAALNDITIKVNKENEREKERLESNLRRKGKEMEDLQAELELLKIRKREDEIRINSEIQSLNSSWINHIKLKSSIATPILIATTIASVIANPEVSNPMNPWPHSKNRPGKGLFRFEETEMETCRPLDYDTSCPSFNYMLRLDKYPFFNSFITHYSPLEAFSEGFLSTEDNICEVGTNKEYKCFEERAYMKGHCPNGISGVHFLNEKGKLKLIKCKDNMEITEDCTFCRRIKKKNLATVHKTSVSLQDAICQKHSDTYSGPRISVKGVCKIGHVKYKDCALKTSGFEVIPFATFKNQGKIYLDNLIIKNVEVITNMTFLCYTHKGQDDAGEGVDIRGLKRFKSEECKNINKSKDKICGGDHVFCERYDCTGNYPDVHCFHAPGSGPVYINIYGSWVKPMCVGYEKVLVERESKPGVERAQTECETCISECKEDGVLVRSTGFLITSGVICSHGSCISRHQSPDTEIMVPYPGMTAAIGGEMGIYLSHTEDSLSLHMKVHCDPRDVCETHHCFLCLYGVINYQCHTTLSLIVVSTILSCSIYMILCLLGKILYLLKIIPKKLRNPFAWIALLITWMISLIREILCKFKSSINTRIGWYANQNDLEAQVPRRRRLERFPAALLIIALMLPMALSCSETLVSNSKQTKCVQEGSKVRCSVTATITMKAGVIGGESCFMIKGPSENQQKTIKVKTVSSEIICREGPSFWTSHFVPSCLSSRRCHLVGGCTGNKCQSWRDDMLSGEFAGVKDNSVMNENKCFEQCGAAGCGCFNINPSCLFVHTTLKSARNEAIRVFKCADWVHRITFEVNGPSDEKDIIILSGLGTKFLPWGTISLSLDAESVAGSNDISFLESSNGGFALYDESYSEMPREGFLGEIRCSSASAAINAHKSCIRAPNLVKYKPMTDQIDCTASLVDPFAVFVKGSLPQVRKGMTYTSSKDKKTVQAFNSGSIQAFITINIEDHDVTFTSDVITCDATFQNMTGCYSCNYGSRVCLKIKASGGGEFWAKTDDGSINLFFEVTEGTDDYCQTIHFSKPLIEENLKYSCGSADKLLVIKGLLVSIGLTDYRNETGGSSIVVNPTSEGWSLSNWFGGFISWLGGPIKGLLKILGFLLLGLAIGYILYLICRYILLNALSRKKKN
nr:M protein [Echarate-like virus Chanchamayo-2019]